jgi:hypothetical protein
LGQRWFLGDFGNIDKTEIEEVLTKKIESNCIFNLMFFDKFNSLINIENDSNKHPYKY